MKYIIILLFSIGLQAQAFDFYCEPVIRGFTITSGNTGKEIEITDGEYLVDAEDYAIINIELNRLVELELSSITFSPVLFTPNDKTLTLASGGEYSYIGYTDTTEIRYNGKLIFRIHIRLI